jgi:hypothetical protein
MRRFYGNFSVLIKDNEIYPQDTWKKKLQQFSREIKTPYAE